MHSSLVRHVKATSRKSLEIQAYNLHAPSSASVHSISRSMMILPSTFPTTDRKVIPLESLH